MSKQSALKRPRSLSVLAVIMMFGAAIFALVICLVLVDSSVDKTAGFAQRTVLMMTIVALFLGSGVGLWKGTYWGWGCGLLLVGYNFAWNTIPIIDGLAAEDMRLVPLSEFAGEAIRLGVFAILLAYLLRQPIMEYCRVANSKRPMALLLVCGAWGGFTLFLMATST